MSVQNNTTLQARQQVNSENTEKNLILTQNQYDTLKQKISNAFNIESETYSLNVVDAIKYGTDGAIFLKRLRYWLKENLLKNKNIHNGLVWTYDTLHTFTLLYPFWSKRQIERIISNLITSGAIKKGEFNKKGYDRTKWYTLSEELYPEEFSIFLKIVRNEIEILPEEEITQDHITKRGNAFHETGKCISPNGDTYTSYKTDFKKQREEQSACALIPPKNKSFQEEVIDYWNTKDVLQHTDELLGEDSRDIDGNLALFFREKKWPIQAVKKSIDNLASVFEYESMWAEPSRCINDYFQKHKYKPFLIEQFKDGSFRLTRHVNKKEIDMVSEIREKEIEAKKRIEQQQREAEERARQESEWMKSEQFKRQQEAQRLREEEEREHEKKQRIEVLNMFPSEENIIDLILSKKKVTACFIGVNKKLWQEEISKVKEELKEKNQRKETNKKIRSKQLGDYYLWGGK